MGLSYKRVGGLIMGEYNRTYKMISDLEKQKAVINARIKALYEQIDQYVEQLHEINVAIGECEGYLAELRYIDGGDY